MGRNFCNPSSLPLEKGGKFHHLLKDDEDYSPFIKRGTGQIKEWKQLLPAEFHLFLHKSALFWHRA